MTREKDRLHVAGVNCVKNRCAKKKNILYKTQQVVYVKASYVIHQLT